MLTAGRARTIAIVPIRSVFVLLAPTRERLFITFVQLESFLSTQIATILEHVATLIVQRPKAAFARLVGRACHFHETVVERQRMANRILPTAKKIRFYNMNKKS